MKTARILFCSSFIDNVRTGSAVFARLFLSWANENGIEVDTICPEVSTLRNNIPLVSSNKVFRKTPILNVYHRSYIYYKTVEKQLEKQSYDVVFFNSVTESLHTAKLIKETSVFGFLHDENFLNDYKKNPSFKRKIYRQLLHHQERKACHFLDKILTNSQYMKAQISEIYDVHPIKIGYSYFRSYDWDDQLKSLQIQRFDKTKYIRLLFVKHDYERGGLEELAMALQEIDKYQFSVTIVGPQKQSHSQIKKWFGNHEVYIHEFQSREEIYILFQKTDIFCVPTRSEAMGLANMEAMLHSVAVISTDIPVMNEFNKKDSIMFQAKVQNYKSLQNQIEDCIEDDQRRNEVVTRAFSFTQKELSYKQFGDKMTSWFS